MRISAESRNGLHVESDDLDNWIVAAQNRRQSSDFRLFEVDKWDGRWFLLSEQSLPTKELLVHAKEITEQKTLEVQLLATQNKLRDLALTDELTGVANRRSFMDSAN